MQDWNLSQRGQKEEGGKADEGGTIIKISKNEGSRSKWV